MQHLTLTEIRDVVTDLTRAQIDIATMTVQPHSGWTAGGRWVRAAQVRLTAADTTSARQIADDLRLTPVPDQRWTWRGWRRRDEALPIECIVQVAPTPEFLAAVDHAQYAATAPAGVAQAGAPS